MDEQTEAKQDLVTIPVSQIQQGTDPGSLDPHPILQVDHEEYPKTLLQKSKYRKKYYLRTYKMPSIVSDTGGLNKIDEVTRLGS